MSGSSPAASATCARARSRTRPGEPSSSASAPRRATSSSKSEEEGPMMFSVEEFGRELDAIRDEVMESRGERDRRYVLRLIRLQRGLALGGRLVIFASLAAWHTAAFLPVIALGTGA